MAHPLLTAYPVALSVPVQWGEMDAYGHVNNTIFFRWFESARIAFLERCGMIATMERDQIGAILHSTGCRFRRPVFYPDTVEVGGRAKDVGRDRFTMEYLVVSRAQDAVVGEGTGVIVCYDYQAQAKTPLPDSVARGLEALCAPVWLHGDNLRGAGPAVQPLRIVSWSKAARAGRRAVSPPPDPPHRRQDSRNRHGPTRRECGPASAEPSR